MLTDVNKDLLSSTEIGNEMFTKFVEERMEVSEEKRTDFFQHTKIQNLNWIRKSKNIRELSWMSHNASFCSFL